MVVTKKYLFILAALLAVLLGVSACLPLIGGETSQPPEVLYTQAAATIGVQLTLQAGETAVSQLTQVALQPTATATPPPTATLEPSPTSIPPTNTPIPPTFTPLPPTATPLPCNLAAFVADVTIPDGTVFEAGQYFTKTWRLKNVGSCRWTTNYDMVFVRGERMDGSVEVAMPANVNPGETVDLTVTLRAPSDAGTHTGYWQLRDPSGQIFALGSLGEKPFLVRIEVKSIKQTVYNFADNYCAAVWSSNSGVQPCPGSTSSTSSGYVVSVANPQLETGSIDNETALFLAPDSSAQGFISGKYPAFAVKSGDHFRGLINCAYPNKNCYVQFEILYTTDGSSFKSLGSWDEKNEGQFRKLDVDLSSLAGQNVSFILRVSNNSNSNDDVGVWLAPSIVR